jgi:hypothetical protein
MKKEIITTDIRKQGEVDVGFALDTLVLGMVVWHEEGEQDGHPVSSAVGDSDGTQLRATRWVGRMAWLSCLQKKSRTATQSALPSKTRTASSWDTAK